MPPVKYDPNNALRKQGQTEAPANPVNVNVRNRNFSAEPSGTNWAELSRNVQGIVPEEPVYEEEPEVIEEQSQEEQKKEEKKQETTLATEANPLATAEPVVKEEKKEEEPIPAPVTTVSTNTGTYTRTNPVKAPREDEPEFYSGSTDSDDPYERDIKRYFPDGTETSQNQSDWSIRGSSNPTGNLFLDVLPNPVSQYAENLGDRIGQRFSDAANAGSVPTDVNFVMPGSVSYSGTRSNQQGALDAETASQNPNSYISTKVNGSGSNEPVSLTPLINAAKGIGGEVIGFAVNNANDMKENGVSLADVLNPVGRWLNRGTFNASQAIADTFSDAEQTSTIRNSGLSREDAVQEINAAQRNIPDQWREAYIAQQEADRRNALRENAQRSPVNPDNGLYENQADIDDVQRAQSNPVEVYSDPYERALNAEYANAAMRDPYERDVDINNVPQNPVNRPDPYERDAYAAYRNANASDPYERDVNLPMRLQYNTPITAERRAALRDNAESNNPVNPNKIEQIINPFTSEESRQAGLLSPEGSGRPDNLANNGLAEAWFETAAYRGWSDVTRADYANKASDIMQNLPADWTGPQMYEYVARFFDADGKFHWNYEEATQGYLPDNLAVPTIGKDGRTNDAFDTILDDYHYEDADGQRLYRGDDGKYYYGNGNEYKGDEASQVYNLTPEQYLELWIDPEHNMRGGVPGSLSTKDGEGYRGLENLPEEVFAIIATNHIAAENFEEIFNGTDEEYNRLVDLFMGSMPALQSMVDNGMVSMEDIIRFFFKTPKSQAGKKSYGGYGGGRYYGGGGGGYRGGGSSTYRPNPTTTNQKQSRIYNIMKNWSF